MEGRQRGKKEEEEEASSPAIPLSRHEKPFYEKEGRQEGRRRREEEEKTGREGRKDWNGKCHQTRWTQALLSPAVSILHLLSFPSLVALCLLHTALYLSIYHGGGWERKRRDRDFKTKTGRRLWSLPAFILQTGDL